MFGGDRKFYFVLPDDRIRQLRPLTEESADEKHILHVYSYPEMSLIREVECSGLTVDIQTYIPANIQFIPDQYFRNYTFCYIVDKSKRHVLSLGGTLDFIELFSFEEEIERVVTGIVSPYFFVQFGNRKFKDLTKKLTNNLELPEIEIKCAAAFNVGIIIVDYFNRIHIYENSNYIKKELGIENTETYKASFETVQIPVLSSIEDVQAGFFHVIFRTKDGRIFAAGYDTLNQVSFGKNLNGQPNLMEHPLDIGHCVRAGCFSRGQYLINSRNDIFFISEMFSDFPKTNFTHKDYNFVNVMNFDDINIQTMNVRKGEKYNVIVNGGWHCFVAFDHRILRGKANRFKNLLLDCSISGKTSDISISFR